MKEKLTAIHNQALRILETVGIRLHHAEILERIQQHGVSVKNNTAFFTPDLIMDAVRLAPESFTLHARNPRYDMVIGAGQVNCAPGYGCASICGPDGARRNAVMGDYVRFAKLVHQCPHFNVNGGILAQPSDVPAALSHLLMVYAAMLSSDKCLMGIPGNGLQMQELMDLGAIVQMISPGTPVIFGLQCLGADLRTGNISIGSPAYTLQSKYTAALARMYRLPSRCGGTLTDAPRLSPQSGYESMLNMLAPFQNGVNLIVHSAGTLDSVVAMSYEKFIMDIEIIDMVRYYLGDLEVNDDTLNMELIRSVGPGGQFLTTMDTMRKCRTHAWDSDIGVRGNAGGGSPEEQSLKRIAQKLQTMLDAYSPPPMDRAVMAALDAFMMRHGVDRALLATICSQAWENSNGHIM